MNDPRNQGATFAPDAIGWLDFETRSPTADLKAGTYRYVMEADAIICAYAIGDGETKTVAVERFGQPLGWPDMPADFKAHHARVNRGEAIWCAWNAAFDRAVWNYATGDFPLAPEHHFIDAMAQATISGLPPSLAMAARFAGTTAKLADGKDLIKLFCVPDAPGTPETHQEQWFKFMEYACGDITAMRDVFRITRQLPLVEWEEYWAMEKISVRGIGIDLALVQHACWLAKEDKRRSAKLIHTLTDGAVGSVDQVAQLTKWLLARLAPEGREILLKREQEIDDDGVVTRPAKFHLTRRQVERLIAFNENDTIDKVLQLRLYGGSKSPAKFQKMWAQQLDGVLYGQYVFSGAPQTGRASSKGVQIHNLTRTALPYEYEALELILNKCSYEALEALDGGSPVARKLALLIRPAFVPDSGNVFVWSDWSNIEARITPWLADSFGARQRLDIFREVDADPAVPDIYTRTAADLVGIPVEQVTPSLRQRGKVVELALGFLGGVGALHAMAASYGMHFTDTDARRIVDNWRAANPWAMSFGQHLWAAALAAFAAPNFYYTAGRIGFIFVPNLLRGSLLMRLPSGRFLTYRSLRWELVAKRDADDRIVAYNNELTYARGHGRQSLWNGIFVENATQAVAADILRGTLVRLVSFDYHDVRAHTHDEILLECADEEAVTVALSLRTIMRAGFAWSEGLPIMSEEIIAPYYTKTKLPKLPEQENVHDRQYA